ncbi:MAG: stage II sporulation protein M, partial [Bradymonadaceae bacterium]
PRVPAWSRKPDRTMGISQASFVEKNEAQWRRFEDLLDDLEKKYQSMPAHEFPELYRQLCNHLSIARHRGYSTVIVARLNILVERGHALLYGSRVGRWGAMLDYASGGFARQVRAEWRLLLLATILFVLPGVAMFMWLTEDPSWTYHVLGPTQMSAVESMYSDSVSLRQNRDSDSDILMFGFYIRNNTGIGLRTFGSGLVFGLGALVVLAFNSVFFGAVAGHLQNAGLAQHLWPFVIGHGAFELTAIVFAGKAGFKLGFAPIWPGRYTRMAALRKAARESVGLIAGFSAMFFIAAFIEAFWSSSAFSPSVKYAVGTILWILVDAYFTYAGRGRGSR